MEQLVFLGTSGSKVVLLAGEAENETLRYGKGINSLIHPMVSKNGSSKAWLGCHMGDWVIL